MIKKELWCMEIDVTNWREEWKNYTSNRHELDLLENGAKSLSQSWLLSAMFNKWKRLKGYTDPPPPDVSSSYGEWEESIKKHSL
tara:strand:- start:443 stop:694 length:252 start_codon:yes stop_codon:yes gene_type:complete